MIATAIVQIDEFNEALSNALSADRASLMLVIVGVAVALIGSFMIQYVLRERKDAQLRDNQAQREAEVREVQSKRDETIFNHIIAIVKDQATQNEKLTDLISQQKDQRERDSESWRNELNATSEAMVTVAESVTELTRAIRDLRGENQRHNDDTKATLDKLSTSISQVKISVEDITKAINAHRNDTTTIEQLKRVESVVTQLVTNVQKFIERVEVQKQHEANRSFVQHVSGGDAVALNADAPVAGSSHSDIRDEHATSGDGGGVGNSDHSADS